MERILYLNDAWCAAAEDGRLVEYIPSKPEDQTGEILTGRVERMMPGLEAAFVDIGRRKAGFLPLKENSRSFRGGPLRSGDRILVQIRKEETGEKGAFLTRDLSIPGSLLILMPMNRHIGVSSRITDEGDRQRLIEAGKRLAGTDFGLVMREAALNAEEAALREELARLMNRWNRLRAGETEYEESGTEDVRDGDAGGSFPPARTGKTAPARELIRDYGPRGIDRVVEDEELPADLKRQLKEAENRVIRLPHGGNIVIDRCEAMTVIDVNSASDAGDGSRRETVLRTNLEACREIMIQVRLRNLAGILILDMIDMDSDEDRERVLAELAENFRRDRIKTVIHGYTSLGLIEMTRKRSRATWQEGQRTSAEKS